MNFRRKRLDLYELAIAIFGHASRHCEEERRSNPDDARLLSNCVPLGKLTFWQTMLIECVSLLDKTKRFVMDKEYFAFISYQRKDEKWAEWLQHQLEHYRLPSNIIEEHPELPCEVRPLFRDATELSGGVLAKEIDNALENSLYLIVICSPNSAKSIWVNREVQKFLDLGKLEYIIPFIVEGVPYAQTEEECFVPSLVSLKGKAQELLGISVSEMGREVASIKVVAQMLNLKFDLLWQRYEKEKESERLRLIEINNRIKRNLARFVAEKISDLVDDGDSYTARVLALEVLPTPAYPDFPYTPEAECAFRKSMVLDHACFRGLLSMKSVAMSPDCKKIVAVSSDHTTMLWDANNGQKLSSPDSISYPPIIQGLYYKPFVCFARDSEKVLYPALQPLCPPEGEKLFNNILEVWDSIAGKTSDIIKYPFSLNVFDVVNSARFDSKGKNLVIASQRNSFCVWNMEKKAVGVMYCGHTAPVNYAEFSPDDKRIVSASKDFTARVWSSKTGRELVKLIGHKDVVFTARFSPDGKHVVTVSGDGVAIIWSAQKGCVERALSLDDCSLLTASYSPDGKTVVTALSDGTIALWNSNNGKPYRTLCGHTKKINATTISDDGKWVVSASEDQTVRLWDINSKRELKTIFGHKKNVAYIDFKPDGSALVSCSLDGTIKVWDTKSWEMVEIFQEEASVAVYSVDGSSLLTVSRDTINVRNLNDGGMLSIKCESPVVSANFSFDTRLIVASMMNGAINVYDVKTGQEQYSLLDPYVNHDDDYISCVTFSHDNRLIAAAYQNGIIRVYHSPYCFQNNREFVCGSRAVQCVRFSNDDRFLVAAYGDNTIKIWDVASEKVIRTMFGHASSVSSLYISPDNRLVVSGSYDNTVKVWDLESGVMLENLEGHKNVVNSVVFSTNGRTIASASYDSTIKIWDFPPLQELIEKTSERFKDRPLTNEERHQYYLE